MESKAENSLLPSVRVELATGRTAGLEGDDSYSKAGVVTLLADPLGFLVKGKNVEIDAGAEYTIFVDGDRTIKLGAQAD